METTKPHAPEPEPGSLNHAIWLAIRGDVESRLKLRRYYAKLPGRDIFGKPKHDR